MFAFSAFVNYFPSENETKCASLFSELEPFLPATSSKMKKQVNMQTKCSRKCLGNALKIASY